MCSYKLLVILLCFEEGCNSMLFQLFVKYSTFLKASFKSELVGLNVEYCFSKPELVQLDPTYFKSYFFLMLFQ